MLGLASCGAFSQAPGKEESARLKPYQSNDYSGDCLSRARQIFLSWPASRRDDYYAVNRKLADLLSERAVVRGKLDIGSWLSPPSSYMVVQLTQEPEKPVGRRCPLESTYVRVDEGGFNPFNPPTFHGPLGRK